jgi:peptidylglycine monooxygenase
VAFGPDGTLYVADGYGASRIHRFSPDGTPLASWGSPGNGPGQFTTPHGLWVLGDGRVLVADRENDRVQAFSATGDWLATWTDFPRPMDIWSDPTGAIYVTDQVPRLSRLGPDGTLTGRCRPVLNGAHGIAGDAAGRLYLAEVNPSRVTRLVPAGPA